MSVLAHDPSAISRHRPLRVAVLGCTGSIGKQTLDVCRRHADKVRVVALSAHASTTELVAAAREFGCTRVVVSSESHGADAVLAELPENCALAVGHAALAELCALDEVDCVVNALVGFAGIEAGLAAADAGKVIAYANKESIVVGGALLMPRLSPGQLVPIDSEHSAIFQALVGERGRDLARIWLTCSGGPFFGFDRDRLSTVTAADALAHPTWTMGAKITIDCATLMNKGLEVMEAAWLFGVGVDDVCVLVHRQSRIHSMVEFSDGSVKAQLGPSDMRGAIQYALSYPERWDATIEPLDWRLEPALTFDAPDTEAFGCLSLAYEAGRVGGTLPCALNAANEVANAAFLSGAIGFLDIERIVEKVMSRHASERVESLEQLVNVDAWARREAGRLL